jgi:SAM-dependent methyltransferase
MHTYLGTFLIALSTLALEVTLTRLLSVITWYHLAFFAIATAMLGMTAGAVTVYLKSNWFSQQLDGKLAKACLAYSLVTPIALIILCLTPLVLKPSIMSLFALIMATIACSVPFYFSGIVITVVLTQYQLPIGKIYASDLIGASLGCLLVLGGLEILDAPSLILLCAAIGILAGLSFAWRSSRYWGGGLFIILLCSVFLNSSNSPYGIGPLFIKSQIKNFEHDLLERWNSFSRVAVFKRLELPPQYWGASPVAPREKILPLHFMNIDGEATTGVQKFSSLEDIEHLRFDVTNIGYYLRPKGGACIIGVGGGRDLQGAILFGHEKVIGVDVNPIFIDLLQNEFREFAGLADREEVTFVVDEARSYLSRTQDKYSIIQMSLIDTWAATGAGAFSLSENALYTTEAWQIFLNRLHDDGIFTVSRWYDSHNLGETGRIVSLAVASLLNSGIKKPAEHIAMITIGNISTLLLSKQAFSEQDVAKLKKVSADLAYNFVIVPSAPPSHEVLRDIVSVSSLEELSIAIADKELNYEPTTDENPYFFNMLRLQHIYPAFQSYGGLSSGVLAGNLHATLTLIGLLISLFILTIVTIIFPLFAAKRESKFIWSRALYFSLIGAGFMFVEIALIQRLSVFLGHPVYALGILLFTIIASTGIGSFLSTRLPLTRWLFVLPLIMVSAIILTQFFLPMLISSMITSAMLKKIVVSVIVIFPLGMLMGLFFPTGMRLVKGDSETPWYWALNGIFGVLCSALAVFFSIYFGISTNFYIAACCYAMLLICFYYMPVISARSPR